MDARLTEAFTEYERLVERVARLRYELAGAEAQLAHERDVLIGAARAGARPTVKAATAPSAKLAPKPKPPAAPAPKAAPRPAPAAKPDPDAPRPRGVWTEQAARLLWPALTPEWQGRFRKLLAGPVPVAKLFPGESHVGPLFAGLTHKSRAATHINSSPVVTEDGTARLADGLDVALRAAGVVA